MKLKRLRQKKNTFTRMAFGAILALLILLPVSEAAAQDISQMYNVYLIGQVTNQVNGAPLKGQEVFIESPTITGNGFEYFNTVYTNEEGFYYDTIFTPLQKGALIIYTKDYLTAQYDTTVHYRFNWSESNILFANFKVASEFNSIIQANFKFHGNPQGNNNLEYMFSDLTNLGNVLFWTWDFGDGCHSDAQNPTHVYEAPGLYKVSLTITIGFTPTGEPITSTVYKIINVTTKTYYHMGGHVFAGSFPIDKSEVFLYKIEGSEYIPIDTAIFNDTFGYFLFYQLLEGEYILKADLHPTSTLFNAFMTTYYSDKLHWDEADTIFHQSTSFEYDINLVSNDPVLTGWGKISGDITFEDVSGEGKSIPAENISILLYDEYEQALNICHSDQSGNFEMEDLDMQLYYVYAEVTGKVTYPVEVVTEDLADGSTIIHLVIDENSVSGMVNSSIDDNLLSGALGTIFPNPVSDEANLIYTNTGSGNINYSVISINGQTIFSSGIKAAPGSNLLTIDVRTLPQGMYFIRFTDQMNHSTMQKIIKK